MRDPWLEDKGDLFIGKVLIKGEVEVLSKVVELVLEPALDDFKESMPSSTFFWSFLKQDMSKGSVNTLDVAGMDSML